MQSNRENREHQKYSWNVIVLQEKSQSGMKKLNCKQQRELVCGSVVCSHVLIFAVIYLNTINILEIFQVFTVFPVSLLTAVFITRSGVATKAHQLGRFFG